MNRSQCSIFSGVCSRFAGNSKLRLIIVGFPYYTPVSTNMRGLFGVASAHMDFLDLPIET